MNTKSKIGWSAVACAIAALSITQFLAAQVVGPPVFTPQMTVSPGFLTVTTGPTSVQNLTINGTCTGCVGAANFANPTGTIGLTAVNGSAVTGLRSDGAPALSQAIVPTWTGIHAFNGGTSGVDAPFTVDSTFLVTNLNADLLDGITSASFAQLANSNTFTGATQEIENAAPIFQVDETDAASNERNWLYRSSAGILAISTATDAAPTTAVANAVTMDRTGTTVDSINLQATSVQKNGVEIATYETGSFTVNYGNACTTTPSQTWDYIKIGNQVTIKLDSTSGFPCTGDVTSFSSGAVPAALIPPDNAISPVFGDGGCQDNGTVVQCSMSISGGLGLMSMADCSGGAACNATGWQATGNRAGFALGVTFSYSLDP